MPLDVLEQWRRQRVPPGFIEDIDVLEIWRKQREGPEPTWWQKGWRELTKPREKIGGMRWEAFYRPDIAQPFALGITGEDIEKISVAPEWQGIQQKIKSGVVLTEDEISFVDDYLAGHVTRPPGFTAEQWLAQPRALQTGYNVATTIAVIMGATAPIWTHPSFPPMIKRAALKLYRGKLPERIPSRAGVVAATPEEAAKIRPTFVKPSVKIAAPTKIVETAIKQLKQSVAQVKIVKTEVLRGKLESVIYKAIKQVEPGIKKARLEAGVKASIDSHLIGAPVEVSPRFAKATIDSVFEDFPRMLEQVRAYGEIAPAVFKPGVITPEEEIVEREMGRPLTPTPEEYAVAEIPKEELEILPEEVTPVIKPSIPPTSPPSEMPGFGEEPEEEPRIDPIAKLNELIKQAEPLRKQLEKAYTAERAKRIGEVEKFIGETVDKVGGEKGYRMILSKLKGELAPPEMKVAFEPVKERLTPEELKALYVRTWKHPYLDNWEKVSAAEGLTNLLMGGIPQPKKLVLLEEVYGSELIKNILSKRVWGAKATDFLVEAANVPRAALATADMSAFLRQGIIPVVAHPEISAKAVIKTFQFAFKPETFEQYFKDLPEHRHYKLIRQFKVAITDPSRASMVEREEAFISQFLQKIPIIKIPVKFAERAYVGFLNKVRVDVFSLWVDELLSKGFTPVKNPEEFRAAADVVNNFTGRGSLPVKLDRITPQLNTVFFSPRLIAARFNALNPVWYAKQPKEMRVKAIGDFGKFVAAGLTTLALIKLTLGDKVSIETDPRSSDFGKIRIGNTRWDIWGGFQQWARVFTQLIMGERKSTVTGEIVSLNKDEYPFTTRKEVLLRFIEGKLAPVPQLVNELISGAKTFGGEDITAEYIGKSKFIPMYIQDIAEAYADGGLGRAVGAGVPAFFGVGVQTWLPRKRAATEWWR